MNWLKKEIVTGIQKLLCLRLEGTPSEDMVEGTIAAWYEAITNGKEFDQDQDAPRVRAAFTTLASTRERWPAPKHFLEAMPERKPKPELRKLVSDADQAKRRAAAKKALDDLAEKLRMPT